MNSLDVHLIMPWFLHLAHFGILDICWLWFVFDFFNMTFILYFRFIILFTIAFFSLNFKLFYKFSQTHALPLLSLYNPPQLPLKWFQLGWSFNSKWFFLSPWDTLTTWYQALYHRQTQLIKTKNPPNEMFQKDLRWIFFRFVGGAFYEKHFIFYFYRCWTSSPLIQLSHHTIFSCALGNVLLL